MILKNNYTKVAIDTLGCKLNQAESESLARKFVANGYQLVNLQDKPDIYIVNTCTVTHIADRKSRHLFRMARRFNPNCFIIAAGCYATAFSADIRKMKTVDLIVNNHDKEKILDLVMNKGYKPGNKVDTIHEYRTRAVVKVQDGCNRNCSYCIVPKARGKEKIIPLADTLKEVNDLILEGYQEVVISGTRLGANKYLNQLIFSILEKTNIKRLRLSSLQPESINSSFLRLWEDRRLCRHIHMPLQSGSNVVLKMMKRDYDTTRYAESIMLINNCLPDLSVTTDIIVGFPGETNEEFKESVEFCKKMGFSNIHVFPYSPRPGTLAAKYKNVINQKTKRERIDQMLSLANDLSYVYRSKFIGKICEVLWESKDDGLFEGFSENYIRIFSKTDEMLKNRITNVKLISQFKNGLLGNVVN